MQKTITLQSYVNPDLQIAEFYIAYILFGDPNIEEIVLPLNTHPLDSNQLVFEMPLTLWKQARTRPFGHFLPWRSITPPIWTNLRIECGEDSNDDPTYVPIDVIPGHFRIVDDTTRFAICDNINDVLNTIGSDSPTPPGEIDLLVRLKYGPAHHYHGHMSELISNDVGAIFQKVPIPLPDRNKGIEYWMVQKMK